MNFLKKQLGRAGVLLLAFSLMSQVSFAAYPDVGDEVRYATAINYLTDEGIVNGYPDGSFKPHRYINRAEFLKIIVEAKLGANPEASAYDCFTDVAADAWYSSYVCYAEDEGIIAGYDDGFFRPAGDINLVEAVKMLVNVFEIPKREAGVGEQWYLPYMEAFATQGYVPDSFSHFGQKVKRDQMAEMTWRLLEEEGDQSAVSVADLDEGVCYEFEENVPENVDMERVRSTWLGWYNGVRAVDGLHAYTYNDHLARSAVAWSETAKKRGYMDHKRVGQTAYYDYAMIRDWFADQGLVFRNDNRVTFTENIGWSPYSCSGDDCTDALISAIRYSFDFYMAEKDKDYKPHYSSVMNAYFNEIGLGIAVDEANRRLFLTVHYGTEIISDPGEFCGE
jgi:hypothetical protein